MNPIYCFLALLTCVTVSGQNSGVRRLRKLQASSTRCIIDPAGATSGCSFGQFCQKDLGQCRTKNFGFCQPKPEVCPMMYMPVCGCNGQTYGNSCTANGAGTIVSYTGECIVDVDVDKESKPENDGSAQSMSMSMPIYEAEMSIGLMSLDYENPMSPQDALIGTSWTAQEVALDVNITAPITLKFDLEYGLVHGNTGCNSYSGGLLNLTDNSFSTTSEIMTTRMYCDGLMEQEIAYLNFLKDKAFFYELIDTTDDSELVLFDHLSSSDGEGETILARYVSSSQEPR